MNGSICLLTEHDVAAQLKISLAALRRWRCEARGPHFLKIASTLGSRGGLVRYRREDVESWLAAQPTGGGEGR